MTFLGYLAIGVVLLLLMAAIQWSIMSPNEFMELEEDLNSLDSEDTRFMLIACTIMIVWHILMWPISFIISSYQTFKMLKGSQ